MTPNTPAISGKLSLSLCFLSLILAGSPGLAGCVGFFTPPGERAAARDDAYTEEVEAAKRKAEARPGDVEAAVNYAELLGAAYDAGTVQRGRLDGQALVPDALAKLDAAIEAHPDDAALLTAAKGTLLVKAGEQKAGVAEYEASMEIEPNIHALIPLIEIYKGERRHAEIDAHCEATRPSVSGSSNQDQLFALLAACASARPGRAPADALPWASSADVAFYEERLELERTKARAEPRQPQRTSSPSGGSPSGAGGGRYSARVSVHNDCPNRVRVFRGRVHGSRSGSGTYGWHSSNSTTSYHLHGDDELCIVQDHDVVSCTKPRDGARLEITESCSGFTRR